MGPTINSLASEYEGRAVIGKLDFDDGSDIVGKYRASLNELLFFKDGELVDRLTAVTKAEIAAKLDSLIGG